MDQLEVAASQEYAVLDVEVRHTEAFERMHEQNPEAFAAVDAHR